jgi:hypothetical protein
MSIIQSSIRKVLVTFICLFSSIEGFSQTTKNLVYVDKQGVLRYSKDNKEAAFFGVNYTVPFAYGYRSHKALGVDLEKAIEGDVYHMSRLGLDAFRVHVWDVEISDSLGNLLDNEHLRLFDYLIGQLKKRNIKILITPIAFWGNGYPERDIRTNGFSYVYGKDKAVVTEGAIKAQENYLQQIMKHVNPYTKLSYKDDPEIIAAEINNEPHHSGPKEKTTEYINRLATAIRSTGWTKPILYNISESPTYADAVAKANVDGHSFQWYPTGLVAGHELHGNFLPNVDKYNIPFIDTIPQFRNRMRAVYEFDAGDVLQSDMYPAIVRSFRAAGFQWVTQFAYDPMATAYANTEYQTHYLNLAYTPSKAISLLIASKAFHRLPRGKSYGIYPNDTLFDVFRVSYINQLSEMNSEEEFYYSNTTTSQPKNISKLKHIAGVGSSPVIHYQGYGAYFLDKQGDGVWRLEVMPDAITIRDPIEKASPKKEVTRIQWQEQPMQIMLPDIGSDFLIGGINEGNNIDTQVEGNHFSIRPGVYLIQSKTFAERSFRKLNDYIPPQDEFVAPQPTNTEPFIKHQSLKEVTANKSFTITAKIVGIDSNDKVSVELRHSANRWKTVPMQRLTTYDYSAEIPVDMVKPGLINYRIIIQKANEFYTFPAGLKGNPYAWDYTNNDTWQTFVVNNSSPLEIFNATNDRTGIMLWNTDWRNNIVEYVTTDQPGQLVLKTTMNKPVSGQMMGWQFYFADQLKGRQTDIASFTKLVVRAKADSPDNVHMKLSLITTDAQGFATDIILSNEMKEYEIPLSILKKDSVLLLPRPYPGFQPLWFQSAATKPFAIEDAEKLQVIFGNKQEQNDRPCGIEVESVWLK